SDPDLILTCEECSCLSASDDIIESFRSLTVSHNGVDALGGGKLGCLQFCAHAAGASSGTRPSGKGVYAVIDVIDLFDQLRIRVKSGITVVEPVDVGEDHEAFRPAENSDNGGEHVVISEESVLRFDF